MSSTVRRPNTVFVQSYLGCRLEVQDDGGDGWIVRVHDAKKGVSFTLRNRVPTGLEPLLAEARERIDRIRGAIEGPRW